MNWKLPPETEMEGFYESVRQGSRYHPYHKPENEIWHRKQQNGFNVNGMQQVTGPNQHHMWGRRAPSSEMPVPRSNICQTQSSVIAVESNSVGTVVSSLDQRQSTISTPVVTNTVQPLCNTLIESSSSSSKPLVNSNNCIELLNKFNSEQLTLKTDAVNDSNLKVQDNNMQPATRYRIITLSPELNKTDIKTASGSPQSSSSSPGETRTNHCPRNHIHTRPHSSTTAVLPPHTNVGVHLPSSHGPPQCFLGKCVPHGRHIHTRAPCPEKYKNKGIDVKNPIVIDSDDEDEQKDQVSSTAAPPPESPIKKITLLPNPATITEKNNDRRLDDSPPKVLFSPSKRAKMSAVPHADTPTSSTSTASVTATKPATAISSTASLDIDYHGVSQLLERIYQDRENSTLSSSSGDSVSSFSSVGSAVRPVAPIDDSIESLHQLLKKAKETRPYKKLRTTLKNLYSFSKNGNIGKVIALLAEGCNPNEHLPGEKGKTAMHAAAAGGHVGILKVFRQLVSGDFNVRDCELRTPLFDAVEYHRREVVEYLIENDVNLSIKDENGMTCLHVAARKGYTEMLAVLLSTNKINVNEKDIGGWTPIMWAADEKQFDATRCLTENGANIHLRDEEHNVPLHWAAQAGCLEIVDLLLRKGSDIHAVNQRGDTALHLAARENNLKCVRLFLDRGAEIDILNNNKESPLEYCVKDSLVYKILNLKRQLTPCQGKRRKFRLLCSDISRGQENIMIPCVNEVDDDPFPDFQFVKESVETSNSVIDRNIDRIKFCECTDSCKTGSCACAVLNESKRIWYTEDRRLVNEIHKLDRPLVYECNRLCKCWSHCRNRVVQHGIQYPLQLFKTENRGWGVRALSDIPKGSFICDYTGELISDEEAETIEDDSYLFDLDCKEYDQELFCVNAKKYGNISRFINHSCKPNVVPVRVFVDHQDIRFPRICFFASAEIKKNEEICSDYGVKFWEVKRNVLHCTCGSENCQYGKSEKD